MDNKNILVVSNAFYPQISPRSFRTTELVKELAKQGHQVTVHTHKNDSLHTKFETEYGVTIKDLGKLRYKNIAYNKKGKWISLFNRALRRTLMLLFEYPDIELMFLVGQSLKAEKGYDLLISVASPFPIHWGVAKAIAKNNALANVWVADCGDPYMGDKADSFKKFFYFQYVEKWFCKKANYISVPTAGSVNAYYPGFHDKIKIIPQGFNFEETKIFDGIIHNEVPTFGYAGGFIHGIRDPRPLLDFLCKYKRRFKFIIYTSNTDMVLPYVAASNNRIELNAYIPRAQLLFELSKMDFLLNINNGTTVQTPSKLIDYALTRRPVLSLDKGILDIKTIEKFLQGDYSDQFLIGDIEQYNIKNVAQKFVALAEK
jgi:glycosyltransferase involved in cell wall biosynthesis